MIRMGGRSGIAGVVIVLLLAACQAPEGASDNQANAGQSCARVSDEPVRIEGGTFLMGQADVYAEEGPVRDTTVDAFWIDRHEVTNRRNRVRYRGGKAGRRIRLCGTG
jgi:formylglycine-generating enzyme required for sulfatase activity